MQIENDNYTWALIKEMSNIDRSVNRSYSNDIQSSPDLVRSEIIEASKKFMEIIDGVMGAAFETLPSEDQNISALTDCYFVWNIVHIFYIDKNNSIAEDFAALAAKTMPRSKNLDEILIRADFGGYLTELKSFGARLLIDDSTEKQKLFAIINRIQEEVVNRINFFKPIELYETKVTQRNTFKKAFENQKEKFKVILKELSNFTHKANELIPLINSIRLLAGDLDFIQKQYRNSDMHLFSSYLLFVDPLLDGNLVRQFLSGVNMSKDSQQNSNSDPALGSKTHSNDDSISSVNDLRDGDLPDDEILENCSDLIKNIIVKCFLHPNNAYLVGETLLTSSPKWLAFHIIKLLLIIRAIQHGSIDNDSSSNYFKKLMDGYLSYLIKENCTFKIFKSYYNQLYNFDNNIKFDYLLIIVFININDSDMLNYLNNNKCAYIVEKAVSHFINAEKCQTLDSNTLISMLSYTNEETVAEKLFEIIFNVKLNEIKTRDFEEYKDELKRLINHVSDCLELTHTANSWRIQLIRDVLNYKIRIANRESLDISFLTQLLSDLDKAMEVDLIISLELIDCINEYFKLTQQSLNTSALEFEIMNGFIRNLQMCRIKQEMFKKNDRYSNLINEAESAAIVVAYGG